MGDVQPPLFEICSRTPSDDRATRRHHVDTDPNDQLDDAAWAALWSQHHGDLVRYVSALTAGDQQAAEDIAQETAIRLWQHPQVLTDGRPIGGWLRTVARNVFIDRTRRQSSRPTEVVLTTGIDRDDDGGGGPDLVDSTDSLTSLLTRLPLSHRTVLFEVYVRDRPIADVAHDLGIPTGTVKSRCHNGLHRLRETPAQSPRCA